MPEPSVTEPGVTDPGVPEASLGRSRRRRVGQTVLAVMIAGGITAAGVGIAYADTTPAPTPTPSATTPATTGSTAAAPGVVRADGPAAGHGGKHGRGGPGGPGRAGMVRQPHIDGTVTAVNGSAITLTDRDGFTRHITTTAQTTYRNGSQTATSSAVHTGIMIHAVGSVDADHTTLDATSITIRTAPPAAAAPGNNQAPAPGVGTAPRPGQPPAPTGGTPAPSTGNPSTGNPATPSTPPGS